MLKKRKVFGFIFSPNTTPVSGRKVVFSLTATGRVDNEIISASSKIEAYTDSTGRFESLLWVNTQSINLCSWMLESDDINLIFNIPDGTADISISDCL